VILVDTNLLLYARMSTLPEHAAAKEWLDGRLNDRQRVGLPWQSLVGFLRIATNSRVFERPDSVRAAWAQVEDWLGCPNVWIPQPAEGHAEIFGRLLSHAAGGANLIPDTHLAALAVEHGLAVCSTDGDFARFPEVNWINPLGPG
jgi:uncharacterized protein